MFEMIADLDKLGKWIEGARNSVKQASGVVQDLICTSLMHAIRSQCGATRRTLKTMLANSGRGYSRELLHEGWKLAPYCLEADEGN